MTTREDMAADSASRPTRFRRGAAAALVAAGVLVAGALAGSSVVRADDAGILDFLRRGFAQPSYRPLSPARPYAGRAPASERAMEADGPRRTARMRPRGGLSPIPRLAANRTLCVRTCDGFAFPIGRLGARSDLPVHEAACQAACPGAATQLYTMGRGASLEDPARARSAKDGSLYRQLATAFMYRTKLAGGCSCQGPDNMSTPLPIAQDRTLRTGDVVVDAKGLGKVFEGSGDAPHPPRAFAEFRRSRAIDGTQRRQVDALLDVSRREAVARDFERKMRVRQAALQAAPAAARPSAGRPSAGLEEIRPPAGSAANVQAFRVVTASASFASANVRQVAPTLIVVR